MSASSQTSWEGLICAKRNIKDNTLEDNLPESTQSRVSLPYQAPTAPINALQSLPYELLRYILLQLDLASLLSFRLVNRRAASAIGALREYNHIMKYALNALRGIVTIGTGRWITCHALYASLFTASCEICGDFAGYLYLIACRRACFLCISDSEEFLPLTPGTACRKFGLDRPQVAKLPCMIVRPGIYSPNEARVSSALTLVDYESARLAGIEAHGSEESMGRHATETHAQALALYDARLATQRPSSSSRRRSRRPPALNPIDKRSGNPYRFAAIVRVPWIDEKSKQAEQGFYCTGCEKESSRPRHWRILFSPSSFESHIKECGGIKNGKHIEVSMEHNEV